MAAYGGTPVTPVQPTKRVQSTPDNYSSKRRSNTLGTPTPVMTSPLSSTTPNRKRYVCLPIFNIYFIFV